MAVVALIPVIGTRVAPPVAVMVPKLIVAETDGSKGESVVPAPVPRLTVEEMLLPLILAC